MQVRDAKEEGASDVAPIPVTVRQLEALVRISESLARMELATVVSEVHVLAAIHLFHASTLDAVRSGMSQAINLSDDQVRSHLYVWSLPCATPPVISSSWDAWTIWCKAYSYIP